MRALYCGKEKTDSEGITAHFGAKQIQVG